MKPYRVSFIIEVPNDADDSDVYETAAHELGFSRKAPKTPIDYRKATKRSVLRVERFPPETVANVTQKEYSAIVASLKGAAVDADMVKQYAELLVDRINSALSDKVRLP